MRVLKVFGCFIFLLFSITLYCIIGNCYDSIRDEFVIGPDITIDLDSYINNVEKNKSEYNIDYARHNDDISFGNIFSVRYKNYRLVGYFCVVSLYIALTLVYLFMSGFCKKSVYETFNNIDDRIIFFMLSIVIGLFIGISLTYVYNKNFNNDNFVSYRYNGWPEKCESDTSKCFIFENQ